MTIFSVSVADDLDNGLETTETGDFLTAYPLGLALGRVVGSGGYAHSGMRFLGVTIPQGSTITTATITTYNEANFLGSPTGSWYAWADDDAPQFSTGGDLPSTVTKTTASETFTISTGDITHTVTSVIQEIVNRSGWASGNAINMIAFSTSADGTFETWDSYGTGTPCFLEIDYTEASGSTIPPLFMHHRGQGFA